MANSLSLLETDLTDNRRLGNQCRAYWRYTDAVQTSSYSTVQTLQTVITYVAKPMCEKQESRQSLSFLSLILEQWFMLWQ